MRIKNIYVRGLRELYHHYAKIYAEKSVRHHVETAHTKKFADYLEVTFTLEDVSPMDFYFLQMFTGGKGIITSIKEEKLEDIVLNGTDQHDALLDDLKQNIESLTKQIEEDNSVGKELLDLIRFPKCRSCSCITTIRGFEILDICGATSIFELLVGWLDTIVKKTETADGQKSSVELYQFPSMEDIFENTYSPYYPQTTFEDYIAALFVNRYANFINHNLNQTDYVTDSFIFKKEFVSLNSNQVIFNEILTPVVNIDMTGDPDALKKITAIREAQKTTLSGVDSAKIFRMRLTVRTSLYTFLTFVMITDFSLIRNVEDLRMPITANIDLSSIEGSKNYEIRIGKGLYSRYATLLNQFITENEKRKERIYAPNILNFVPNWIPIRYTLEGTLEEFVMARLQIDTDLKASSMVPGGLIEKELHMIRDAMEKYTKSILSTFPTQTIKPE